MALGKAEDKQKHSEIATSQSSPYLLHEVRRKQSTMQDLSLSFDRGQITMSLPQFQDLVAGPNRDYWVVILATSVISPKFMCARCISFQQVFNTATEHTYHSAFYAYQPLIKSILTPKVDKNGKVEVLDISSSRIQERLKSTPTSAKIPLEQLQKMNPLTDLPIYFVVVDPATSPEVFSFLNLHQAPISTIIPPGYGSTSGLERLEIMHPKDLSTSVPVGHITTYDTILDFITRHTSRKTVPPTPISVVPILVGLFIFIICSGIFLVTYWDYSLQFFKKLYPFLGLLCIAAYIFAVSGGMFNRLNNVRWSSPPNPKTGEVTSIHTNLMDQFGFESLIVAFNYTIIVGLLILSTQIVQRAAVTVAKYKIGVIGIQAGDKDMITVESISSGVKNKKSIQIQKEKEKEQNEQVTMMENISKKLRNFQYIIPYSSQFFNITRNNTEKALDIYYADIADGSTPLKPETINTILTKQIDVPVNVSDVISSNIVPNKNANVSSAVSNVDTTEDSLLESLTIHLGVNLFIILSVIVIIAVWCNYLQIYSTKNPSYAFGFLW